jgi:hypothetical protein
MLIVFAAICSSTKWLYKIDYTNHDETTIHDTNIGYTYLYHCTIPLISAVPISLITITYVYVPAIPISLVSVLSIPTFLTPKWTIPPSQWYRYRYYNIESRPSVDHYFTVRLVSVRIEVIKQNVLLGQSTVHNDNDNIFLESNDTFVRAEI